MIATPIQHSARPLILVRSRSRAVTQAFTLIELLTVIAVIGVLAGLTLGIAGAAKSARVNGRAKAELQQIQSAIEAYKGDRHAFPPDHKLPTGSASKVDPVVNQLFYELRGTEVVGGKFRPKGGGEALAPNAIQDVFGRGGFLNASQDANEPSRTYLEPKASSIARVEVKGVPVQLLVSPFDWPRNSADPAPLANSPANPWRYVSSSPTNNAGSFDLWTEVYVGKEKRIFKNW